jgi:hypothetical protein
LAVNGREKLLTAAANNGVWVTLGVSFYNAVYLTINSVNKRRMGNGDLWRIRKEATDALYGYYQIQKNPVTANFPGEIRTLHISNEIAKRSTPACSIIFRYCIQGFNHYSSFVLASLYFYSFLDTWIIT